ncbi:metallophosphoesterase [Bacillus sp. YZJH907-2]|uniref:Metallophosphoesterase n=1 Tax=Halalkalibacter suaedae TaxID=2822140 RepID=A0A941AMV8_9BACI|nr:metallophosphoesterase [Bacillus suaedae]MBP3950965.1 metallophosphoesterase [Bacillus suaedae]
MIKILQALPIFLIINGVFLYLGWNGWVWLKVAFGFEHFWLYLILFSVLCYSYVIGRSVKMLSVLRIIGAYWFGVIQYGLLLLPVANLVVLLVGFTDIEGQAIIFWTGVVVLLSLAILLLIGTYNAYSPVIRTYEIHIPKPNSDIHLRLGVASDMHFGGLSGISHAKKMVQFINSFKPDLILLPGDVIDDQLEPFISKNIGNIMSELQASLGVYGVLGNHEYYGGDIPEYIEEMKKQNISILTDDIIIINDTIQLIGRKDKTDRNRKTIQELTNDIDPNLPLFMMDHQPAEIMEAREMGVDFIVSGHTHRGQMAPNHLITKKIFELDWGYLKKGQLHAFVSSGYGFWGPPLRIGSRSEILQIDITFHENRTHSDQKDSDKNQ